MKDFTNEHLLLMAKNALEEYVQRGNVDCTEALDIVRRHLARVRELKRFAIELAAHDGD